MPPDGLILGAGTSLSINLTWNWKVSLASPLSHLGNQCFLIGGLTRKNEKKNSLYETCLGGSDGKESACNVGDLGLTPGSGRSPGEVNDNPLQYSCLENPMGRGAWQATVYGVAKSWTRLSDQACTRRHYLYKQQPFSGSKPNIINLFG